MICSASRLIAKAIAVGILLMCALPALAQSDPDPNSPVPVLLGIQRSPRVPMKRGQIDRSSSGFVPNSEVTLLVGNISLMKDEGAGAFRVYAEDKDRHQYRFPVIDLRLSDMSRGIYALTVESRDEIGFFDPPEAGTDLLLQVSWRGNASNQLDLSSGQPAVSSFDAPNPQSKGLAASGNGKDYVGYRWSGDRMRFLEQAAFGPTDALDSRVRRIGLRTWLAEQFDAPYPSASNPYPNIPLQPTTATSTCDGDQTVPDIPVTCSRDTYTMYPIQTWFYREAFYGDAQLRHRVAWALAQTWVISGVSTQQSSWMINYHQTLSRNAFGNWRQLMGEMTLNPGMGNYLNMMGSTKNNPNENYPREILQLFNIGLFMLNPDGTVQCIEHNPCQAGDTQAPTYDQTTINNFTKVFTGWRDCNNSSLTVCPNYTLGAPDYKDPMLLVPNNHDLTAKTLLSYPGSTTTNIPACPAPCSTAADRTTYANNSLNQALDNIYGHPNIGPFVAKHLIQALVTSDPTPAYVARVSAVFDANRASSTQLREVVRAILLDPEARGDVKTDPHYGKLREPLQLATNVMRLFNVTGAAGFATSDGQVNPDISPLGQNLFNSPTVFNFYPPDYVIPGTSLLGPEFAIFTTGTSIGRANLANTYVMGSGRSSSPPDRPNGTRLDLTDVIAKATADTTGNQMLDYLNTKMMHGTMSAQMKSTILPAVTAVSSSDPTTRARVAVYLIMTSSQYQVQR